MRDLYKLIGWGGRRSAPVAGNARGGDLDVAAANKRPAAGRSKETLVYTENLIQRRFRISQVKFPVPAPKFPVPPK
jgi:hypothetical protein